MKVDLSKIDVEEDAERGVWHELTLPDGTKSNAALLLRGMDSPKMDEALARYQQREAEDMKPADYALEMVKAAAMGCRNLTEGDEPVQVESLPRLIEKHRKWVVEQCFRVIIDRTQYLGKSGAS